MPYVGREANSFTTVVDVTVSDDLTVTDDATIGGALSAKGGAVFNEDSADVDFRVESNGNANMLFVDGGNNAVGIGTPIYNADSQLHILASDAVPNVRLLLQSDDAANATSTILMFSRDGSAGNKITSLLNSAGSLVFGTNDGTEAMRIDATGAVTKPLQPAFNCILGAGNQGSLAVSTLHTVLFTEVYDQNADFASNTFTAPVTGKYQLQSNLYINAMDDATSFFQLMLVTSNRTYYAIIDPRAFDSDPGQCSLQIAVLADMDASDTAVVKLQLGSGGSAQSSIYNNSNFSGFLAC